MAKIIKPITVDVAKKNLFQAIVAKQNDNNSRFLKVTLVNEGEVINIDVSSIVTINARRADGASKTFMGVTNEDGTATVPLTSWMLELDDTLICDISVFDTEGNKLTSTSFEIDVESASHNGDEIVDDENYDLLIKLLADVARTKEEVEIATNKANSVASHLPTISEDGYWMLWDVDKAEYIKTSYYAGNPEDVHPILEGNEPPTTQTKGEKGQLYYHIDAKRIYICRAYANGYLWEPITVDLSECASLEKVESLENDLTEVKQDAYPPSRNLLKLPDYSISAEENKGVAVTIKDGLITIKGTNTDTANSAAVFIPIKPPVALSESVGLYSYAVKNFHNSLAYGATVMLKDSDNRNISSVYAVSDLSHRKKVVDITTDKTIHSVAISVAKGVTVNQSFNLQLETGEYTTSYVPADGAFGGDTTKTVESLNSNVVLASYFGAVGDGVNDDTEALQEAIRYCSDNYKMLKLDSGKTYLISKTLEWDNTVKSVYLDGNFATIFAKTNLDNLLKINCLNINDAVGLDRDELVNYRQQVIKNLVLDCNGVVNTGLRIDKGYKMSCNHITITDPVNNGIYVNQYGYENFITNIHITRVLESQGCVGVYAYGSDNTFDNIVIIGCEIGVLNVGGDNHFSKVHPWSTTKAPANLRNSISFDCRNGYCTFNQCIGDSTGIIFRFSNNAKAMITNCANAWSNYFINALTKNENGEFIADVVDFHLFYFVDKEISKYILPHENKGKDVTVSACYFKTKVVEGNEHFKCHYSNLDVENGDSPMLIDRATTGWENQPVTIEDKLFNT